MGAEPSWKGLVLLLEIPEDSWHFSNKKETAVYKSEEHTLIIPTKRCKLATQISGRLPEMWEVSLHCS